MFGTNMDTGVIYAFAVPAIPTQFTDDVKDLTSARSTSAREQELTQVGHRRLPLRHVHDELGHREQRARHVHVHGGRCASPSTCGSSTRSSYAVDNMHPEGGRGAVEAHLRLHGLAAGQLLLSACAQRARAASTMTSRSETQRPDAHQRDAGRAERRVDGAPDRVGVAARRSRAAPRARPARRARP